MGYKVDYKWIDNGSYITPKADRAVKIGGTNEADKFLVEQADGTDLFQIDTNTPVMSTRLSHNVYNQETHLANLTMQTARVLYFGTADDSGVYHNGIQTPDTMTWGLPAASNSIIFCEKGDLGYDFAHAQQTNPTIFGQSANQSATEWWSLTHDQVNAVLNAGTGGIDIPVRLLETQGADVASATNLTVGTDGNAFELTGTTKVDLISNVGWQEGSKITLIANENVTIDHGTATDGTNITIKLAGAGDFAMTADDILVLMLCSTTAGAQAWREVSRSAI